MRKECDRQPVTPKHAAWLTVFATRPEYRGADARLHKLELQSVAVKPIAVAVMAAEGGLRASLDPPRDRDQPT